MPQIIHIHADAPLKPAAGSACNGCGLCCLVEPCPVGMLVSRRRKGRCDALVWSDTAARYHCGLLTAPEDFIRPVVLARGVGRIAKRLIAAGQGCDSDLALEEERNPVS